MGWPPSSPYPDPAAGTDPDPDPDPDPAPAPAPGTAPGYISRDPRDSENDLVDGAGGALTG